MIKFMSQLILVTCLIFISATHAGTASVEWQDPDSYLDIRHSNSGKLQFRKSLFNQFEKHFSKLAQDLPDDVELKIKVTNLNLAGDVRYSFAMHREIRIVKHTYWPMIEFEYQLNKGNQLITSDTVKLKDMFFMDRGGSFRLSHDSYFYEKRILTDWFDKTLQVMVAEQHDLELEQSSD